MKRVVAVALLMLAGMAMMLPGHADAATKKYKCHGKLATQVLTSPGTLYFTEGDDVFYGSSGNDEFLLTGNLTASGTDIVCGNDGNDVIIGVDGYGSIADGGSGVDFVVATYGAKALGGPGDDYLVIAFGMDAYADGGSGNEGYGVQPAIPNPLSEYLPLLGGLQQYIQWGGVWAINNASADGGANNDTVSGYGASKVLGGSGRDAVWVGSGNDRVDCGSDQDVIYWGIDATANVVRRCELNGSIG